MRIPDPKANTTTEAYLAYKAGYLEESELKPVLYEPYLHFDGWLAYWAGLVGTYPVKNVGKNLFDKNHAQIINGYFENEGTIIVVESNRNRIIWLPCKENTTYTVKGQLSQSIDQRVISTTEERPKNGTSVKMYISGVADDKTFTTPKGASFILIRFQSALGVDIGTLMQDILDTLQIEEGSTASAYEPYAGEPEMLTDEEALVAYLSGVTDTYPEEIKDPYDVRIVGYLRHLASIRWPEPDYPVNNEEFYLSTMEPTHTSNYEPSSDIEMDTAEGKIISVEAYGDTYQQTYTGEQLYNLADTINVGSNVTVDADGWITVSYDNTSGVSNHYENYFTGLLQLQTNTDYRAILEVKTVNGTGRITCVSNHAQSQFQTQDYYSLSDISDANIYAATVTTKTDFAGSASSLRTTISWSAGESGSITFRLSLLADISITPETFVYQPYTGGVPAPNPDYPQDVQTVTGEQNVWVHGKNWIGYESPFINAYFEGDGAQISASDANRLYYVPCRKNTTYAITTPAIGPGTFFGGGCRVGVTNELPAIGVTVPNVVKSGAAMAQPSTYATTVENAYFVIRIQVQVGSGLDLDQTAKAFFDACQIEIGTATAYEPCQSQSYTVDLGSIELCKIGDYQDYIYNDGDDWYLHKEVVKISPNGTETWMTTGTQPTGQFYVYTTDFDSIVKTKVYSGLVSDNFTMWRGDTSWLTPVSVTNGAVFSNSDASGAAALRIMFPTSVASSVDAVKTWLSSNLPVFYYPIATPTDTKITDATLVGQLDALANADTYNEKTYISVIANYPILPALLKVEAYKY